jgi:myo-inositol-1(or 4)-monophosphatase
MSEAIDPIVARDAAIEVARAAGAKARDYFLHRDRLHVEKKGVQDLVSEADREVEDLIRAELSARFPDAGFVGEERGVEGDLDAPLWVIDPIDGTSNFLRGIPHWCVSIGLHQRGDVAAGVIFDPCHDELFAAASGFGATLNGQALQVSATDRFDESVVAVGVSRRVPGSQLMEVLARLGAAEVSVRKMGSAALGAAWVTTGRVDAFFELHLNPWDTMAALCLVREAGGRVNDFLADGGLADGNAFLASNPALADELFEMTGIAR